MINLRQKLSLILLGCLLAVGLLELGVRLTAIDLRLQEYGPTVEYFWSSPVLELDRFGVIRYLPHSSFREVALAGDRLEFDFSYPTNNLGFVDDRDYLARAGGAVAIVGDSFTAGVGSGGWMPRLREELPELEVYNLGVVGTGLLHFEKLIARVREELSLSALAVMAICDDFERPFWVPQPEGNSLRFCQPGNDGVECLKRSHPVYLIGEDWPVAAIFKLRASHQPEQVAVVNRGPAVSLFRAVMDRSRALRLINFERHQFIKLIRRWAAPRQSPQFLESLAALARIGKDNSGLRKIFLHLPDKRETAKKRYLCELRKPAEEAGFKYLPLLERCHFTPDSYYPFDHHFTPARIFLGDTGSMFLGFSLATVALSTSSKGAGLASIWVPLLALGMPIFDTFLAIWRRAGRKLLNALTSQGGSVGIMSADKEHFHHRLVALGFHPRNVVAVIYLVNTLLVLIGILGLFYNMPPLGIFAATFALITFIIIRYSATIELWESGLVIVHGLGGQVSPLIAIACYAVLDGLGLTLSLTASLWLGEGIHTTAALWDSAGKAFHLIPGWCIPPLLVLMLIESRARIQRQETAYQYSLKMITLGAVTLFLVGAPLLITRTGVSAKLLPATLYLAFSFAFLIGVRLLPHALEEMMKSLQPSAANKAKAPHPLGSKPPQDR